MSASNQSKGKGIARNVLAALLLLVGLNGLAGGYYGMSGARSVPVEWLEGSPFSNYFIPGLILFIAVGIFCTISAALLIMRAKSSVSFGKASGILLIAWIVIQMLIIGYVSFLQPLMFFIGLVIVVGMRHLDKNTIAA